MNQRTLILLGLASVHTLKVGNLNKIGRAPPLERVIDDLEDDLEEQIPQSIPDEVDQLTGLFDQEWQDEEEPIELVQLTNAVNYPGTFKVGNCENKASNPFTVEVDVSTKGDFWPGGDNQPCACSISDDPNKGELEDVPFNFEAENPDERYQLQEIYHGSVKKGEDNVFDFSSWGQVTYQSELLRMAQKHGSNVLYKDGMPNKDFEISLSFKTSEALTSLFSIDDPVNGGHDRHIYLQDGYIYIRVWPGAKYLVSQNKVNDNQWHSLSLRCETGTNCVTTVDGNQAESAPIDHSNFDWASRINLGYSADSGKQFIGQMKDISYRTTHEQVEASANVASAADQSNTWTAEFEDGLITIDEIDFLGRDSQVDQSDGIVIEVNTPEGWAKCGVTSNSSDVNWKTFDECKGKDATAVRFSRTYGKHLSFCGIEVYGQKND